MTILEQLLAYFGKPIITIKEAAAFFAWSLKTAQNHLSKGTFPVPTIKVGARQMILVKDVADMFLNKGPESDRIRRIRRVK